jgi:hypothetical protein
LLIPPYNLDKGLPVSDNYLYSWHSLYCEMISKASFGIILSIGAVLLFAIWPNILLLQQHLATAQLIPGVERVPTFGSSPADTTAAQAANMTAGQAPANTTNTTSATPPPITPNPGGPTLNTTSDVASNSTTSVQQQNSSTGSTP